MIMFRYLLPLLSTAAALVAATPETLIDNDQVKRLAALVPAGLRHEIEAEVDAEIEAAVAFAEASPYPDVSELTTDVFHAVARQAAIQKAA